MGNNHSRSPSLLTVGESVRVSIPSLGYGVIHFLFGQKGPEATDCGFEPSYYLQLRLMREASAFFLDLLGHACQLFFRDNRSIKSDNLTGSVSDSRNKFLFFPFM